MPIMKTYPAVVNPKPTAIIIHCMDPRFATAISLFLEENDFNRQRDIIMSFPGGPVCLAHPRDTPSRSKWLIKKLRFNFKHFPTIETIAAVIHEDCRYSNAIPQDCRIPGKEALPLIGGCLKHYFPEKKIVLPYAKF